jgi:hypothetical protein
MLNWFCHGNARRASRPPQVEGTQVAGTVLLMLMAAIVATANGRAVAGTGPAAAFAAAPAPVGAAQPALPMASPVQYGLIQTGVIGVARLDGNGAFGEPQAMPVFQVVQLQPMASGPAPAPALTGSTQSPGQQGSSEPPALSTALGGAAPVVNGPAAGTLCDVKGVRILAPSPTLCWSAGGQIPSL